jgi:hypothetical protein
MDDSRRPQRYAGSADRGRPRPSGRLAANPDRLALWALLLAVIAMVAAAASARAETGGTWEAVPRHSCAVAGFAERPLRLGACDVKLGYTHPAGARSAIAR